MWIVDQWMSGSDFKEEPMGNVENSVDANMIRHCEVCNIVVAGTRNWNAHLGGKRHRNALRASRRRENKVECQTISNKDVSINAVDGSVNT
ncbi:hypothetical protein KIN20_003130 [Parelaphostrongylus tenuis]|uniref:C2H2-type domain-containing protein n=1 Tax=Parelaphostrongylus tenuis TaxID=148309 RepID=A0AAD5M0W0_PARTN|nr:hypothetical protein KIN20_003130 [Parelaphostrongylus tenuis]